MANITPSSKALQALLPDLTRNAQISGWYSCYGGQSSSETILDEAYKDAKLVFDRELAQNESERAIIAANSTLDDVRQTLEGAKAKYVAKQASKARKWLNIFSSRVMFYASVLDVLVQHHPEYVSLVWGAMKLLFAGVINHEEMIRQLSKSFCQIAEILPKSDLSLLLYPTEMMRIAVARLYAYILRFIIYATRWYKQGTLAHAWAAIANPWALSLRNHFEDIAEQARQVEDLARSAFRAESRDIHLELRETRGELQKTRIDVLAISEIIRSQTQQLIQMGLASQCIQAQLQVDSTESKSMMANIQLGQLLSEPFAASLPASGECLRFCQSMVQRRRHRMQPHIPDMALLHTWSKCRHSSYLVTESNSGQTTKDFLVNLINLIRSSEHGILWALRFPNYWERPLTSIDILRMLLIQSLQINPSVLSNTNHPITMVHMREAVDEHDWLTLINRALMGMPYVYIVLDADIIRHAAGNDRYCTTKLIEALQRVVTSTVVRLVVSSTIIDERYAASNWVPGSWSKVRLDSMDTRSGTRGSKRKFNGRVQRRINAQRVQ